MAASRCVYVYCEQLNSGFVTRLGQDHRIERIYDQMTELFLKDTDYEVEWISLMDKRPSVEWIVPPFLRIKDIQTEDALFCQVKLQKKTNAARKSVIRSATGGVNKPTRKRTTKAVNDSNAVMIQEDSAEKTGKEGEELMDKGDDSARTDVHENEKTGDKQHEKESKKRNKNSKSKQKKVNESAVKRQKVKATNEHSDVPVTKPVTTPASKKTSTPEHSKETESKAVDHKSDISSSSTDPETVTNATSSSDV